MSTPSFSTEAGLAGGYPSQRFNQRERKLLASVKAYLDAGISSSQIANLAVTTAKLDADAVTNAKLADDAVSLENLDSGIEPSHVVKFAGTFTTAGGDADESITVTGAAATDIAIVQLHTAGATPRTILTAQAATNAINLVFSGDPSSDHIVRYMVLRAAS